MPYRSVKYGLLLFVCLGLAVTSGIAAEINFVSSQIKARLSLHDGAVIHHSDSLYLNRVLLERDNDYTIDYLGGTVTIKRELLPHDSLGSNDTLRVVFTPLPGWLKKSYGRIPSPSTGSSPPQISRPLPTATYAPRGSDVFIKGAKKFSVLSQTGGLSQFNQTLEMSLRGELTPGVEVSGSISDRGYDPSYGNINSRISELDKLYLRISSKRFQAEIGNLEIGGGYRFGEQGRKQVSGLTGQYNDGRVSAGLLLARPRGQFESVRFMGRDGVQGPYRIGRSDRLQAVVPGSETVWLDGRRLERGADKDYVMDYPAATITFSPRILIDSRSRIEIDYEPLKTDFQREMIQSSGGVQLNDSLFFISMSITREGEDPDRLKTGELTDEDKDVLALIGDSTTQNFRDGAVVDSNGAYIIVQPDDTTIYYEYVGDSLGDYQVAFSYVGREKGDYDYDGNNVYRFIGSGQGEYLPIIRIPVPAREDFYEAEIGSRFARNSEARLIIRQSNYDYNLYSDRDDKNNTGGQYTLNFNINRGNSNSNSGNGVSIEADFIEKDFKPRYRRNRPDLNRLFLIPDGLTANVDEAKISGDGRLMLPGPYRASVSLGYLRYEDLFGAGRGRIDLTPDSIKSFWPRLTLAGLRSGLDSSGEKRDGKYEIIAGEEIMPLSDHFNLNFGAEYDRRKNNYNESWQGTTLKTLKGGLSFHAIRLEAERRWEDTLTVEWINLLRRDRISLGLSDRRGSLQNEILVVGQELKSGNTRQKRLAARAATRYHPASSNLSLSLSYTLADESRFERGVRYIEVEPGQGRFIFEDGQYIPDPNGNYIQLEEILSRQAAVKRGEKAFSLIYSPRDLYLRLSSNINEELLSGEDRTALWLLPFFSDDDRENLFRNLDYSFDVKLAQASGFYYVNLNGVYHYESRSVNLQDRKKYETAWQAELNQPVGQVRLRETIKYFTGSRDAYYFSAGEISGYSAEAEFIRKIGFGRYTFLLGYRRAEDEAASRSLQYRLGGTLQVRLFTGGETILKLTGYRQDLRERGILSYRLTDNLNGRRGIVWNIRSQYQISSDLRFSLTFAGRHSDARKPQITGRGELVASF